MNCSAMLNAYPDSLGGTLADVVDLLRRPELRGAFGSFYILPSLFHSDMDRGFSVISYDLNWQFSTREDILHLSELGLDLSTYAFAADTDVDGRHFHFAQEG